ncbi:MAG TPA: histidinol-phosphate transaminase [Polyangiaceae bacterium]|nr:histidinol-phosphate transaminase [Polyangiaceae bacterium]
MSAFSIAALSRPELAELSAYLPDLSAYRVRLDANEAPPLMSPAARARIAEVLAQGAWERYPDPTLGSLRQVIAAQLGVTPAEILPGVGSDEVISLLLTAFVRPLGQAAGATVLTTTPSFVMYRMSARCRGLRVLEVPLDQHWDLALDALKHAIAIAPPSVIFIASPNNPTGNLMSADRLEQLIEAAPESLLVIDEAYIAYSDRDQLDLYRKHDSIAILRTLSKVGLAAFRLGFLLARPEVVAELDKVRLPYNVPTPTQRVAELAFTELAPEISRIAREVVAERARVVALLAGRPGLSVTPSQANFLWLRSERPALELYEALKQRSILVRSFHSRGGRLANQLRVTIGTRAENDELLQALAELT